MDLRFYEFAFIAQQSLLQQEVNALIQEFDVLLSKIGGSIAKHEYWGVRELAYSIKKCTKGHYFVLYVKASPQAMEEFKRKVRLKEEIIRSICFAIDEVPAGDSPMVASEAE